MQEEKIIVNYDGWPNQCKEVPIIILVILKNFKSNRAFSKAYPSIHRRTPISNSRDLSGGNSDNPSKY